jgi:thiamine pyrophosphate-dependent acetolactate synthase large subunit-like protein
VTGERHGWDVIAGSLADQGVDRFFGLMGEDSAPVVAAMVGDHGMRQIVARHESGAVLMADGYARVSGEVGVAVISRGPGLMNALTALTAVRRAGNPVLVVTGDRPAGPHVPHMKDISHDEVIAVTGAELHRASAVDDVPRVVAEAYARAATGRAVVLNLPVDVIRARVDESPPRARRNGDAPVVVWHGAVVEPAPPVDAAAAERVVRRLLTAERPMIVAGRGAAAAGSAIAEIAERVGAPLATSLLGKGIFDGHPLHVGIVGGFATRLATEYASQTDCLVVFGASLSGFTTQDGDLFRDALVIRVDRAGAPPEPSLGVDVFIHADAREAAHAMLAALGAGPAEHPRASQVRARVRAWTPESEIVDQTTAEGLDGQLLAAKLDRLLPDRRTVVIDGGRFCSYACRTFSVRDSRDFHFTVNFGSMGLGMGTAVGAAAANRTPVTVLVIGDGGFMMTLPELETAVRYALPLLVLVFNDGGFGSEMQILKRHGLSDEVARMPTPSLAELAKGLGADGLTVNEWRDLESAAERFSDMRGPLVVDCRINPSADASSEYMTRIQDAQVKTAGAGR